MVFFVSIKSLSLFLSLIQSLSSLLCCTIEPSESTFNLDLANGSGQPGSGSIYLGSGKKTGRPKWVSKLITRTLSFKGRVKTGLTHSFTHEQKYICKWKETWSYRPKFSIEFLSKKKIYHWVIFVFLSSFQYSHHMRNLEQINKNNTKILNNST